MKKLLKNKNVENESNAATRLYINTRPYIEATNTKSIEFVTAEDFRKDGVLNDCTFLY